MKHIFLTGVGACALAAAALPAAAADLPVKAPVVKAPAAALFNWSGLYTGAHCGGAWARTRTNNTESPGLVPFAGFDEGVPTGVNLKDSGWFCGGQLGVNWQASNYVLGLEGDLGYLSLKDRVLFNPDNDLAEFKYRWYGTLTARAGAAWDRSLLYVKGGAAVARIHNVAGDDAGTDLTDLSSVTKTKWGWALGGGWEYALAPNWSWKIEYLYLDFGKYTTPLNGDGETYQHRNRIHTVKLGVNYRFTTGKAPVVTKY